MKLTLVFILILLLCAFGTVELDAYEKDHFALWTSGGQTGAAVYAVKLPCADTSACTKYWATEKGNGTYYFSDLDPGTYDIYSERVVGVSGVVIEAEDVVFGHYYPIDNTVGTSAIQDGSVTEPKLDSPLDSVNVQEGTVQDDWTVGGTTSSLYIGSDTLRADYAEIAGLSPSPRVFGRDYVVGLVIDNPVQEYIFDMAESLQVHGYSASIVVNSHYQALAYDSAGTPLDSSDVIRLYHMGMEIADGTPTRSTLRGLSLATYRAVFDSSTSEIEAWIGQPPRLFIRPGVTPASILGDTMLTVLPEFYDYAYMGGAMGNTYMPKAPIRFDWDLCPVSSFWNDPEHPTYVHGITDPLNITLETPTMTATGWKNSIMTAVRTDYIPILRAYCQPEDQVVLNEVIRWCASKGIAIVSVSEVLDLIYRTDLTLGSEDLLWDPDFLVDLDDDGVSDILDAGVYSTLWLPTSIDSIPCAKLRGFLFTYYLSGTSLVTTKARPGHKYRVSAWYKSVESGESYPHISSIGLQMGTWRGLTGTKGVSDQWRIFPLSVNDSLWHYFSFDTTMSDTATTWVSLQFLHTDAPPTYDWVWACPMLEEITEESFYIAPEPEDRTIDMSRVPRLSGFISADGDSIYLKMTNGQWATWAISKPF